MNLELLIIKPEKLTVRDNAVIGAMQMQGGPEKEYDHCDELIEMSFAVDYDEIDIFEDYPKSIYWNSGQQVKATTVGKVEIPCQETMEYEAPNIPSLTMLPLCQMFADQYYLCEKFFYTGQEFIDFFGYLVEEMGVPTTGDSEAIAQIIDGIIKKLSDDGLFVHFNLR